ncbi:hypothetical protein AGMMS5026_07530 [Endomicrobiia bacterium]|nr:hypothetical protein AGMMS49523_04730 [Endomicrobiia bacterium]GHT14026.1 hypothetical protein AGMMS49571_08890 [Endomicrobiia bacterium]GHT19234.1 hypothetical protein AGMMS49929_02470 [Endomicrobiia bacterium]GHT26822.1 hypothetical protein AGMMS49995_04320 [Endomicrobiia bacterium]GHT31341.1 hypothetical protein AGMMS5026_07530 [Endomicrobiia bacterium]
MTHTSMISNPTPTAGTNVVLKEEVKAVDPTLPTIPSEGDNLPSEGNYTRAADEFLGKSNYLLWGVTVCSTTVVFLLIYHRKTIMDFLCCTRELIEKVPTGSPKDEPSVETTKTNEEEEAGSEDASKVKDIKSPLSESGEEEEKEDPSPLDTHEYPVALQPEQEQNLEKNEKGEYLWGGIDFSHGKNKPDKKSQPVEVSKPEEKTVHFELPKVQLRADMSKIEIPKEVFEKKNVPEQPKEDNEVPAEPEIPKVEGNTEKDSSLEEEDI